MRRAAVPLAFLAITGCSDASFVERPEAKEGLSRCSTDHRGCGALQSGIRFLSPIYGYRAYSKRHQETCEFKRHQICRVESRQRLYGVVRLTGASAQASVHLRKAREPKQAIGLAVHR